MAVVEGRAGRRQRTDPLARTFKVGAVGTVFRGTACGGGAGGRVAAAAIPDLSKNLGAKGMASPSVDYLGALELKTADSLPLDVPCPGCFHLNRP